MYLLSDGSFSSVILPLGFRGRAAFRALRGLFCLPVLLAAVLFAGPVLAAQTASRITQPIDTSRTQVLLNHHPRWANSANSTGAVPANLPLNQFTLVLARSPQQEQAFEQLLADQQNPASPNYHRWLTPAEAGERFGLSGQDITTITGWLQSQGLHVNWVAPSGVFIGFGGTAADIGRAFQTEMHYYKVNGAQRISVSSDPVIPQALAPVIKAVRGLYTPNERPAHHAAVAQSPSPQMTVTSGGVTSYFIAPADFATIYDVPASLTGAGVTIGIVGWSRTDFADFTNFRSLTGATFANPTQVVPTAYGGIDPGAAYTTQQSCGTCIDGQSEATLDVLRAGSTAPGANLLLVVSTTSGTQDGIGADAQYLVNTTPVPAQVMSISFGDCESEEGTSQVDYWNSLFETAAGEGISVFVASGDSGASGCDNAFAAPPSNPQANSPNYICSSSYATCVGGTEFNDTGSPSSYWSSSNGSGTLASALGYIPEGGWNESTTSSVAASGGGVSSVIPTPSWQTGTGVPTARAGRYTPDVAFSAAGHDGYFACLAAGGGSCVVSSGSYSFEVFSGTSAAAPAMAGVAALLDQKLGSAQGNLNPGLYTTAASAPAAFHDVTVASSGVTNCSVGTPSMCNNSIPSPSSLTGGQTGYLVTTGYDEVTGLGSLNVQTFLNDYTTTGTVSGASFTVTGTAVSVAPGATTGNTSAITVTPENGFTGTVALSCTITPVATSYPATCSFSPASVTISGTAAQTATMTVSTTAATTALSKPPALFWPSTGGAVLACLLLFGIPARQRNWRGTFGLLALLMVFAGGAVACGSGGGSSGSGSGGTGTPGTTAGSYTITIEGTSGSTIATNTIQLTVQ